MISEGEDKGREDIPADWPDAAAGKEAQPEPVKEDPDEEETPDESEQEIDETVEETFPASDPPAW